MDEELIRTHLAAKPSLRRVLIWNRSQPRASAVAAELDGIPIETTADLEAATLSADIISTHSHVPLIKGTNLKPGVHPDLVDGYTEQTREADDEATKRALIFVDRRQSAFAGVGDILQTILEVKKA